MNKKNIITGLSYIVFPIAALMQGLKNQNTSTPRRVMSVLLFLLMSFWWANYTRQFIAQSQQLLFTTGVWDQPIKVPVSGTSMLPTIQDGSTVTLSSPQKFPPERGDMVSFKNAETKGQYFLKRIIGIPGDTLALKNGQLWLNGHLTQEPYTLKKDATYGNTFSLDCEVVTVPQDKYFVMGDNRTVSWDSRAIGFVSQSNIDGVIKSTSSNLQQVQGEPALELLDTAKLLDSLNQQRQTFNSKKLQPSKSLQKIAEQRLNHIKDNRALWKQGKIPLEPDLDAQGYRYNLAYEYVTFGYLSEQNVVEQMLEEDTVREYMLSDKFWEAGIAMSLVHDNDCTYPLISIIFTWPDSPAYDPETIAFWEKENQIMENTLNNLQSWVGYSEKDQQVLREAITTSAQMSEISNRIATKMKRKEWLSNKDQADIKEYQKLVTEINNKMAILFPNVQGLSTLRQFYPKWW